MIKGGAGATGVACAFVDCDDSGNAGIAGSIGGKGGDKAAEGDAVVLAAGRVDEPVAPGKPLGKGVEIQATSIAVNISKAKVRVHIRKNKPPCRAVNRKSGMNFIFSLLINFEGEGLHLVCSIC